MARILRGGLYWADLEWGRGHEQSGRRPVLVVSHDVFNERSGTAIVLAVTSRPGRAGYPLVWRVPLPDLPRESWVKVSQVRTLSTERLGKELGRVPAELLREVVDALGQLIQ